MELFVVLLLFNFLSFLHYLSPFNPSSFNIKVRVDVYVLHLIYMKDVRAEIGERYTCGEMSE